MIVSLMKIWMDSPEPPQVLVKVFFLWQAHSQAFFEAILLLVHALVVDAEDSRDGLAGKIQSDEAAIPNVVWGQGGMLVFQAARERALGLVDQADQIIQLLARRVTRIFPKLVQDDNPLFPFRLVALVLG